MTDSKRLRVEMFSARNGDAFLVRCEQENNATNILVDCGVASTYEEQLRPRLLKLAQRGEKLDLLVVTHIDSDHIGGAMKLLEENGTASSPQIIQIDDVWHNSYRHLNLAGRAPSDAERERVLSQVVNPDLAVDENGSPVSVREGTAFAALMKRNQIPWNSAFGGGPIVAGLSHTVADAVAIRVLSPGQSQLDQLGRLWRRQLLAMGVSHEAVDCSHFEDAFEIELLHQVSGEGLGEQPISGSAAIDPPPDASFEEDESLTNGSSIACMVEFGGRRVLALGDSWPSVVSEQLQIMGADERSPSALDVVTLAHHGSRRNTSPGLLKRLSASHFLISTDGSIHNHPDLEALLRVVSSQPSGTTLTFNYPTAASEQLGRPEVTKRYGHRVVIGTGKAPQVVTLTPATGE